MILQFRKFPILFISVCLIFMHCNAQLDKTTSAADSIDLELLMMVNTVDIFQDSKGVIWIGTVNDGLGKYENGDFTFYEKSNGLAGQTVRDITEDSEGNLWIATDEGLSVFNGTEFTNYSADDKLASNDVNCVTIDSEGVVWVGTSKGISRYIDGGFFSFQTLLLPSRMVIENPKAVHSITEDKAGDIWIGSNAGAWRFSPKALEDGLIAMTNFSAKDGLSDNTVLDILEDSKGDFWFATQNGGVCLYKDGEFTKMTLEPEAFRDSDSEGNILPSTGWSLYEDNTGTVYFPVNGQHLYHYNGETVSDFLPDNCYSHTITSVLRDNDGVLWFGGWSGFFRAG